MHTEIHSFFDKETATFSYIVADLPTKKTAVIDPVLGYDIYSGRTNSLAADELIRFIKNKGWKLEYLLETHIHADHLTASHYIQQQMGGRIGVSSKIKNVLNHWVPLLDIASDTPLNGSQFDCLWEDNDRFFLGDSEIKVWHTPGHTPACVSYLMGKNIFVGDVLFTPDVGCARTDFPGGSALLLYQSIQRILSLPPTTCIFTAHDYPTEGRSALGTSTVAEQKEKNILLKNNISEADFVALREAKDRNKPVPKLILPSLQANLRAGRLGTPNDKGVRYLKVPINML